MDTEDRWYVRFRGHTLGPLTAEQVKSSVRRKELGPEDKLASTSNPSWRALRSEGEFFRFWEALTRPMPAELTPLPSPKILWQKKRASLPAAPSNSAVKREEPAPAASLAPPATPSPAKAAPGKARAKPEKKSPRAKPAKRAAKQKSKTLAASALPAAASVAKPSLAIIPEKPPILSPAEEFLATAEPSPSPHPLAQLPAEPAPAPTPKLAEETLSLLEALREWNSKEKETAGAAIAAPESKAEASSSSAVLPSAPAPAALAAFSRPEFIPPPNPAAERRGIELRLNLVISKQFMFIFGLVVALAVGAVIFTLIEAKKMRGPVDSRLPDPSSPTVEPSSKDDPIPQLKAPTRPRRE